MHNILVATDLTANSENAFARAVQLARLSGAKLHVLHVRAPLQGPDDKERSDAADADLASRIEAFIREHAGDAGIEHAVHIEHRGRVYDLIIGTSRRVRADLAIIGRSARSREFPRSVLLTTGLVVVNALCPVLIVSEPVAGNYGRILLEADDAVRAELVATLIADFGPDIRLDIVGISGIAPEAPAGLFRRLGAALRRRTFSSLRTRIAAILRARRLPQDRVTLGMANGDPLDVLRDQLESTPTDLVAVTDMYRRLLDPDLGERTRQVMISGSCDILAY